MVLAIVIVIVMTAGVTGCQVSAADPAMRQPVLTGSPAAPISQQLIITFKRNTLACDPAGIARLSEISKVPLELVRPMSGNACVVRQLEKSGSTFDQGQQILKHQPSIEWVERDALMKTM